MKLSQRLWQCSQSRLHWAFLASLSWLYDSFLRFSRSLFLLLFLWIFLLCEKVSLLISSLLMTRQTMSWFLAFSLKLKFSLFVNAELIVNIWLCVNSRELLRNSEKYFAAKLICDEISFWVQREFWEVRQLEKKIVMTTIINRNRRSILILLNRVVIWTQKILWMFDISLSRFRRRYTLLEMLFCSQLTLRNIQMIRRKRLEWLETRFWQRVIESVIWSLWWLLFEWFVKVFMSKSFERTYNWRVKTDLIQMSERRLSHSVESWKFREMFTHKKKRIMCWYNQM